MAKKESPKPVVDPSEAQALLGTQLPATPSDVALTDAPSTPVEEAHPKEVFVLVKNWLPWEPVVYGPGPSDIAVFKDGKFKTEDKALYDTVLKAGARSGVVPQ